MISDQSLDKSILYSLDGRDENILHHLPYLLQDIWEIGSSVDIIVQILKKHNILTNKSKVLDLGCGKGAVSVNLAKEFGCQVLGIDAMSKFIEDAHYWADKFHQSHLCTFLVGDIREKIKHFTGFDLIILGSIGPILGNIEKTLKSIYPVLSKYGYVVLDDGYIPENSDFKKENYSRENEVYQHIKNSGFKIMESFVLDEKFMVDSDNDIYAKIEKRSLELMEKYPQKKKLFENYLENQRIENDILENKVQCVTWLLQKI